MIPEHRPGFMAYVRRQRTAAIRRYLDAAFVTERQSARRAALHYSRLLKGTPK
jgi:hypothetical protein